MLSGANVEYDLPIPIKDESETLSDIDDAELDVYIHNEEEKNMKKTLWERAYREYLEVQKILSAAYFIVLIVLDKVACIC